jgi:hypothetical protein
MCQQHAVCEFVLDGVRGPALHSVHHSADP